MLLLPLVDNSGFTIQLKWMNGEKKCFYLYLENEKVKKSETQTLDSVRGALLYKTIPVLLGNLGRE